MNRNVMLVVIALIIIIGGIVVFAGRNTVPESTTTNTQSSQSNTNSTPSNTNLSAGTVKEFRVEGKNMAFSPATMTVNKGDKVRITFVNTQGFHDFVLDEFNVKTKQMQAGGQEVVEFTADKTGTFEYYCSVGNHRALGMKGTLTVQ